jgi:hypothetical protein
MTCQGLVTTAFVNTQGDHIEFSSLKGQLPLRHSPEFAKQEYGGHYWAWLVPRVAVAAMLEEAGHPVARDLSDLAPPSSVRAWEYKLPSLVLEGTGFTDLFILPPGEWAPLVVGPQAAPELIQEETQRRAQLKLLREEAPTLFNMLRIYGPAQYVDKQDPDRTLSTFYRYVTQLQSTRLYSMNPVYGHLKPVHTGDRTCAAYLPDLLRRVLCPREYKTVALRAVYAPMGRARWEAEIVPAMAATQNQLPVSKWARGTEPRTYFAQGQVLARPLLEAAHQLPPHVSWSEALDRYARGRVLHAVDSPDAPEFTAAHVQTSGLPTSEKSSVPIIAFADPWQWRQPERTAAVIKELDALKTKGLLLSAEWTNHRKLPQTDDQLTLCISLRV